MTPLIYLPFLLPTLYVLQMLSGPLLSPPGPAGRDTFLSDLE